MNPRNPLQTWLLQGILIGAVVLASTPLKARAETPNDPARAIAIYLERLTAGLPGRVEIILGKLDERLRLAPCTRVEPYVAAGTRLWGKSSVGLRCQEPGGWNVFLPIEVRVYARALVAARALAPGQTLLAGDTREDEFDLTRDGGVAVTSIAQIDGKLLTRGIAAGQPLRQDQFRSPPAVNAGDAVQVVYVGSGFSIATAGRALSPAAEGQPVRVQIDSGRMVQGIARTGQTVELR
jgi:flagellar basal body P-ring formation protein FlgA